MNLAALPLLTITYAMGLYMIHVARAEFAEAPSGRSRRFRTDIDWIVPFAAALALHAFVAWSLLHA
jgi:hypothetical protein